MNVNTLLSTNDKKFIFKFIPFFIAVLISLYDVTLLEKLFLINIGYLSIYKILWLFFLSELLLIFVPRWSNYVGCGKLYAKHYRLNDIQHRSAVRIYKKI